MDRRRTDSRVVVIGAGIGGLVAALSLASSGLDVTVVERADGPGGKIRTTQPGRRPIDCGPTVLTMRDVFAQIFQDAGADLAAMVPMRPAAILARHCWGPGEQLDLHADRRHTIDAIARFAGPAEAKRYAVFCDRAQRVFNTLDYPFMRSERPSMLGLVQRVGVSRLRALARISPFTTLWRDLERSFQDPRLRQLFGRYATYCGSSPFRAPATLMLIAHAEQQGVWLVEGGMQKLAHVLADLVRARGGRIAYRSEATAILSKGGRIAGVKLANGEQLAADAVVVNGDVAAISGGWFGSDIADGAPQTTPARRSLSAVTLAMEAVVSGFPLVRHNVFFSRDYAAEFAELADGRVPSDPTVYVCAQDRDDAGIAPDCDGERLFCIVNAPAIGDVIRMSTAEIDRCVASTIRQLNRCGLTIDTSRSAMAVTTPADFEQLFPATGGALYGQATHGWRSSFQRQGTRGHLPGLYLTGGSVHPGAGVPMAAISGSPGRIRRNGGPRFDEPVVPGGYAWWYLDALSADGRQGLVVIGFIGSVFSPYYAWARTPDPYHHCSVNVALYGQRGQLWAMTERRRSAVAVEPDRLAIGPSALHWDGSALTITLDEVAVPLPRRIRGTVRLIPSALTSSVFALDTAGRHTWWPIAPAARVEVNLAQPDCSWSGTGYLDTNAGDEPLATTFAHWHWSRAMLARHSAVLYDVLERSGAASSLAIRIDDAGDVQQVDLPPKLQLPSTRWGIERRTAADAGQAEVVRTLEDGPFYARSQLRTTLFGETTEAIHESLSLDRFRKPLVKAMLPFRMPRTPW